MNYNLTWDLTSLFKSDEEFYKTKDYIKELLNEIEKFKSTELNDQNLLELLNLKWKIKELTNNVLIYGSLKYYKDVKNEECLEQKKLGETLANEVNTRLKFIDLKILELGEKTINDFIEKNNGLNIYRHYLENTFRLNTHIQDEDTNNQIQKNINLINALINDYNELMKNIKFESIEINGETIELTSTNISKYLSSRNRETRELTYISINKAYKENIEAITSILIKLLQLRHQNSDLEQYESVLQKSLFEENLNPEIIKCLIEVTNKNIEVMEKYLKIKIDSLNIENPHLYDLNVPLNTDQIPKYTIEEGIEIIKNALAPLGKEYLKVVDILLNGHIDAIPDDKKHSSIIFSWQLYSFLNYKCSYVDIKNLIHELGHIVNHYLSKISLPYIYEDSTVFLGETAAIVNEILLSRYMYENAKTESGKAYYLSKGIENYFTSVFKQNMYTELESNLYDLTKSGNINQNTITETYEKLIKKYYGKHFTYLEEDYIEWAKLGHLFRWSYYSYQYSTGLLIASIVVNSLIDEKTISKEDYIKFLSSGSMDYSKELLKILKINLTDNDTLNSGFKPLEKDINKLSKLLTQN
jgi:oligoendopeptidase F